MSFRDLYRRLARGWGSKEKKWEARQHKHELRRLTKEEETEVLESSDGGTFTPSDRIWKACIAHPGVKYVYGNRCPLCIAGRP